MIRVITIEREYGSGGARSRKLAARLGWKLWDQLLTQEIARRLDCDCRAVEKHEEKRDPLYYRLFKAFMRGSYEGSLNAPRLKMVDTDCVREVAERWCRRSPRPATASSWGEDPLITCSRPDAFHVFIYAPFQERVRRLQANGKSEKKRRNWRRPWTATARTSSSNISTSTGRPGIVST